MPPTPTPAEAPTSPPWWLGGGDEQCAHCGRWYPVELERRCPGCDAPCCLHCLGVDPSTCAGCASESAE